MPKPLRDFEIAEETGKRTVTKINEDNRSNQCEKSQEKKFEEHSGHTL